MPGRSPERPGFTKIQKNSKNFFTLGCPELTLVFVQRIERFEQEARKMRGLKAGLALAGLLALARYTPIYLHSYEFDDFVKQEAQKVRVQGPLKDRLVTEAKMYSLPVKPSDINISTNNGVFRVAVDYRVPVDLFVYNHELTFHATGSGLMAR